jgi:predicted transcriptional regulator
LRRQGVVDLNRVVWFNGFHACYLKDYSLGDGEVNGNPFADAGLEPPIVLVRPEPDFAVYFQEKQFILEEAVKRLRREVDARVAVIPRSREQAKRFSENSVLLNEAFYDVPVAYADVTVGAAETMLMESFVLGVPTVSAIYWEPSKPVAELHKYIPHFTSADEVVGQTVKFLDESEKESFRKKSERIVEKMENPIDKIVYEVKRLFEQDSTYEVARAHRRTQIEICIDILRSLFAKPSRFTHILQSANISHRELKKHIRLLMNRDFVEQYTDEFGGAYYKLTDKGLQIVQEYDRIRRELSL